MKFKMVNLVAAFQGGLLETLLTWWKRLKTSKSRRVGVTVAVTDLRLGHRVGDNQRTIDRIQRVTNALPYIPKTELTSEQLNLLLPSDEDILVDKDMTVINGNGRVGALQMGGYKGRIPVQWIQG